MDIIKQITDYIPYNEQEHHDKFEILEHIKHKNNIFSRENKTAHMTASSWILNKNKDKVLMVYHNIYDSWSWLGGHADGDEDLLSVATKEAMEESGLSNVTPITEDIFSLEILTVDGHEKKGSYVSSHLHLNITYLFEADEKEVLSINPDENSGVAWYGLKEAVEESTEPWFKNRIYKKLNNKLK